MEIEDTNKSGKASPMKEPKSPEKKPDSSDMQVEDPIVSKDEPSKDQDGDYNKDAQVPADSMITM